MFSLHFIEPDNPSSNSATPNAEIVIGEFTELLHIPLDYWKKANYVDQWREAAGRIADGEESSVLLVSMHEPQTINFLNIWPLYRNDQMITIYNELLFADALGKEFTVENVYNYIAQRERTSDEHEEVSKWTASVTDFKSYLEKLGQ